METIAPCAIQYILAAMTGVTIRLGALLFVAACAAGCATFRREITGEQIQSQLTEHFPVERCEALWLVRLTDPAVSLEGHDNRATLSFSFAVDGPGVHSTGRARVAGTPDYHAD